MTISGVEEVVAWVEAIGLGRYRHNFRDNMINGLLLLTLTEEELQTDLEVEDAGHLQQLVQKQST